jgi:hypothetical protein
VPYMLSSPLKVEHARLSSLCVVFLSIYRICTSTSISKLGTDHPIWGIGFGDPCRGGCMSFDHLGYQ